MNNCYSYLPSGVDKNRVVACIGLISDTHVPLYCPLLPPTLFEIFQDIDLILHAGDIGDLSVLDDLSRIAPVIAVQGNDDSSQAHDSLPLRQIVAVGGLRILLYHSHHPDHEQEMQTHREDRWQPKLAERIELGRRAGASIVVFGHTHIPMTYQDRGILIINPGSVAPASVLFRQLYQTVAILFILKDGQSQVVHVDLSNPKETFMPIVDWDGGFKATVSRLSVSLIDPELRPVWPPIETYLRNFQADPANAVSYTLIFERLLRITRRCWTGRQPYITRADLIAMVNEAELSGLVSQQVILDLKKLLS